MQTWHIGRATSRPGHTYFFSIGDFGVVECENAYKAGDDGRDGGIGNDKCQGKGQIDVAEAMAHLAAGLRPAFVLSLGDNFYDRGVKSLDDAQFRTSFEDVYARHALADVKWKITLGDHDHRGNVTALMAHTQRSPRWELHAPYYSFKVPIPGRSDRHADVVVIDSIGLEGGVDHELQAARRFREDYTDEFAGAEAGKTQWSWLEKVLEQDATASPAGNGLSVRIIVAHRPVVSNVNRSRTQAERWVEKRLREMLKAAAARTPVLFLNGHDHAMQFLEEPGANLHYVGNGVGGMELHNFFPAGDPSAAAEFQWGSSTLGFLVHELGPEAVASYFVGAKTRQVLHSVTLAYASRV